LQSSSTRSTCRQESAANTRSASNLSGIPS
jgi:hypothetical protein